MTKAILIFSLFFSVTAKADMVFDIGSVAFDGSIPAQARAETLAKAAEILSQGGELDRSRRILRYALQLDPQNLRAALVSNQIEAAYVGYEFIARSRLILNNLKGEYKQKYLSDLKSIKECEQCWRAYTSATGKPFRSGADIKEFFKKYAAIIDRNIEMTIRNQDRRISVQKFDPGYLETPDDHSLASCPIREVSPNVFVISSCMNQRLTTLNVDRFDWESMRIVLLRQKMEMTIGLAYSLDQLPQIIERLSRIPSNVMKFKIMTDEIRKSPAFGRLVDGQSLRELVKIGSMGSYLLRGMLKDFACKDSGAAVQPRVGYFRRHGPCEDAKLPFFHGTFEDKLKGRFKYALRVVTKFAMHSRDDIRTEYETDFDMRPLILGRIGSLQDFIPATFDKCGRPKSFANPTASGTLPRGDLMTVVSGYGVVVRQMDGMECKN